MASQRSDQEFDAEKAVLGALLLNPTKFADVAVILGSDGGAFGSKLHRRIFTAMGVLFSEKKKFDSVMLCKRLEGHVAPATITELSGAVPSSANVLHYAEIVRKAKDKEDLEHGLNLAMQALENGKPVPEARAMIPEVRVPGIQLIEMAEVKPESVEWLWRNYLPRGKLTILDGDPGVGKSTIAADIAARISTGNPFPLDERRREPAGAIIITSEDGASDTIRPRLDAAGADVARIAQMPGHPTIPSSIPQIAAAIKKKDATLLVIDPIMAHLDDGVNSHKDSDIRMALSALAELADRTRCAVLIIRHLNKSGGQSAIHRGGGSIGIIGCARMGLIVGKDPADETRRIMAITKSNLGPEPQALAYKVAVDPERDVSLIRWDGVTQYKASDLIAEPRKEQGSPALYDASEFLRDILSGGPRLAVDVYAEADEQGIKKRTLNSAKKSLGVERQKQTGQPHGPWEWFLPESKSLMPIQPCNVATLEKDKENSKKTSSLQGCNIAGDKKLSSNGTQEFLNIETGGHNAYK